MANNITLSYPSAFHHQFLDLNGKPLTGGKLYTYIAGSTTPVVTYKTISGGTESANRNTNPIILDMAGMAELVIATDTAYKFVLFDKNDAKIAEWDNVTGNIGGGGGVSEDIVVVGTPNEIDVSGSVIQGVKRYVISLSNSVKITILQLIGLYNNVLNSLGNKADKVQGATAGNLAALDASGNLTDSGSKAADFKTKQTPVADPSASGAGLEFIDSVSQNANGEITPHKKSVQDGSTSQKGVVQLQDSVGSTESSTDKAVTPHAVREAINAAVSSAYHAAGTKSVAQLTSSLLVAENEGCVYNITDSGTTTSDFVDGAGHPINAGDNVGVCDVGGGVYKFDLLSGFVDLTNYLTKTGDASNTTSSLTKASGDTSGMTSGSKLSVIFTAISNFFASLKALAFKDKASYNDLSSGVQSSLDKADSALQSHQSVTDNNPTLSWGTTSKVGTVGSTNLQVTMPANPAQNLPASVITSGTFGTDRIADDAITADKVKDNETLPVNISGTAKHLDCYGCWHTYGTNYYDPSKPYSIIGERNLNLSGNTGAGQLLQFEFDTSLYVQVRLDFKWSSGYLQRKNVYIIDSSVNYSTIQDIIKITYFTFTSGGNTFLCIRLYVKFTGDWQVWRVRQLDSQTGDSGYTNWADFPLRVGYRSQEAAEYGTLATYKFSYPYANDQVGSPTTPVYVNSNGQVRPCDPSQMDVGAASYASAAAAAASGSTLETQVNKGLAAYKETYTNVTLIQGNIYSKTIVLEIGQENSSGNGIRLFLNNNNGTFEVSIRSGTWNSWMAGGSVIWMLQASFGVGVNSPVTKINNDTKSLAILTTQNIGGVDIGGSPGQYPVNGTISGRFYFVNNASSGILTFEASFSTSQSTQYGGLNDTFVIGKAEWTSFADHKVTPILT